MGNPGGNHHQWLERMETTRYSFGMGKAWEDLPSEALSNFETVSIPGYLQSHSQPEMHTNEIAIQVRKVSYGWVKMEKLHKHHEKDWWELHHMQSYEGGRFLLQHLLQRVPHG